MRSENESLSTIPNILSLFRLVAAPFLILLAWYGYQNVFLILLAVSLMTDAFDGILARWLHQRSKLGTRLDSYGDLTNYFIIPIAAYWLWPDIVRQEINYFIAAITMVSLPLIVGVIKFRQIPSYHTWSAKISAIVMIPSIYLLFLEITSLPFHLSLIVLVIMSIEEITITLYLNKPRHNVISLWHILNKRA